MQPQGPRQFNDIVAPSPSPSSRPVITPKAQVQDSTVTRIPVQVNAPIPAPAPMPTPAATPAQANSYPAFTPLSSVQPQFQPTPPPAVAPLAQNFSPMPTTPAAQPPKFGALQSKIEAHPLFSGAKEKPAGKKRGTLGRVMWILSIIIVLMAIAYVVIDSGVVNTNINLPFHVFKQSSSTIEEI